MRFARRAAKALLALFIILDALSAWEFWRHGPPMLMSEAKEIRPGEITFKMTPAPFSQHSYAALMVVIALHAAFIAFLWWTRRVSIRSR